MTVIFSGKWFWLMLLSLALNLAGCKSPPADPYRYITLKGNARMYNFSRYMISSIFVSDSSRMATMPARNGDLVYLENNQAQLMFRLSADLPDTLELRVQDSLTYLNGKLFSITLNAGRDLVPWFRQMDSSLISGLRSITIESHLPPAYLTYLDRLVKQKPELDIFSLVDSTEANSDVIQWLAANMHPAALHSQVISADIPSLGAFSRLQCLSIQLKDSANIPVLPAIAGLQELVLLLDEGNTILPDSFLHRNPQIDRLSIYGNFDPAQLDWKPMRSLRSLQVYGADSLYAFSYGAALPQLESLSLYGSGSFGSGQLSGMKHLKELGLPEATSQETFNRLMKEYTQLESLRIYGGQASGISDYSLLAQQKKLKRLIISDSSRHPESLHRLGQLEYLSLPGNFFSDRQQLADLKAALPATIISPNEGFCMGSGWILLLAPLLLLSLVLRRLSQNKVGKT